MDKNLGGKSVSNMLQAIREMFTSKSATVSPSDKNKARDIMNKFSDLAKYDADTLSDVFGLDVKSKEALRSWLAGGKRDLLDLGAYLERAVDSMTGAAYGASSSGATTGTDLAPNNSHFLGTISVQWIALIAMLFFFVLMLVLGYLYVRKHTRQEPEKRFRRSER